MTIDRQKGDLIFECDGCGEVFESNTSDFNSAFNMAKRAGWRARKINDVWSHYCDCCQEEN